MRVSDARLRYRKRKLIYPDHRRPPWLTEDATPRSLEPIVRELTATRIICWAIEPLRLIPRLHLLEINVGRLSHFRLKALQVTKELLRQLLGLSSTPVANNQNGAWVKATRDIWVSIDTLATKTAFKGQLVHAGHLTAESAAARRQVVRASALPVGALMGRPRASTLWVPDRCNDLLCD
jgi:hypothetical protein